MLGRTNPNRAGDRVTIEAEQSPGHWSGNRVLAFILVAGLAVRLALLYATRDTGLMILDEQHYRTLALSLLHGHGFAWGPGNLTSIRPPLYPAFEALIWSTAGADSLIAVRAAQILISLANVWLLYYAATLLFDRRTALLAAGGLCFYPSLVAFNFFLLTEVIFTFLLTLLVVGCIRLLQTGNYRIAVLTGVTLGLAALTRSVLWPLPVLLAPFVFFTAPGERSRRLRLGLLLVIGYASVVAPWAVRNTKLQKVLTVVNTMGGITLRMGNYEHTPQDRAWDPQTLFGENSIFREMSDEHLEGISWTEGQKEKWAAKKALVYMVRHPLQTLDRSLTKFANFWGLERTVIAGWQQGLYRPPRWSAIAGTLVIPLAYTVATLFGCLGIFLGPPADRRMQLLLLLVIVFVAGMHSLAFGHARYHLPLMPIVLLYAASAIRHRSWREWRQGIGHIAAPAVACMFLIAVWAREVFVVESHRIQALLHGLLG